MVVLLRFVVFVVRALGLLLLLRFLTRGLSGSPARATGARRAPPRSQGAQDLVRDRICNTFVPRDRAIFAPIAGRDEAFCSEACRDRALAEAGRAS